jgi:hypothetical protein
VVTPSFRRCHAPSACPCCGGALHKIGEDVTETLELIPRQCKVIQHVREKFSCRSCESITQPLFTLTADKRLSFNFEWVASDNERTAETFKEKLESAGFKFPEHYKKIRPSVYPDEWLPGADKFLAILSACSLRPATLPNQSQ